MIFISQALSFGLAAGTAIGPLHTLLMTVTLAYGWRMGVFIALSPLMTDVPIILLMTGLLSQLPSAFGPILNIIGAFAVSFIAYRTYVELQTPVKLADNETQPLSRTVLLRGMMMNFLNPAPYIFWGTITGPLLRQALDESVLTGALFLLAFYGTFLGLMLIFMVIFDRARSLNPQVIRVLSLFSVGMMAVLGVTLLIQGIQGLTTLI
jgi:threonine/homoserine/homoserine lactone efflux protein